MKIVQNQIKDLDDYQWDQESIIYKEQIQKELMMPIQGKELQNLIKEMPEKEKRLFARVMNISVVSKKGINELVLIKEVNKLIKGYVNIHIKIKLYISLFQILSTILKNEDENSLEKFIQNKLDIIEKYGYWHYYWALYLHDGKYNDQEYWKKEMMLLDQGEGREFNQTFQGKRVIQPIHHTSDSIQHKMVKVEQKMKFEMDQRILLEQEIIKKDRILQLKDQKINRLIEQITQSEKGITDEKARYDEYHESIEYERKLWANKQREWNQYHYQYQKQIKELQNNIEKLETIECKQEEELNRLYKELESIQIENSTKGLINRLIEQFRKELDNLNQKHLKLSIEHSHALNLRNEMRKVMDLLDLLEEFVQNSDIYVHNNEVEIEQPKGSITNEYVNNQIQEVGIPEKESKEEEKSGTFYRRAHGGYIELEDGEIFSITESLVNFLDLKHEAEVICTPQKMSGRYNIKIVFQGDDDYAPIQKYEGYIKLGIDQKWYCVDAASPDQKFPLHDKDLSIIKPKDGTPCSFNVPEDGFVARISRIHNLFQRSDSSIKVQTSTPNKKRESISEKSNPFLQGSRIAVVGGQRKWFEEVVISTGAEMIHDDGYTIERITTDLKKANALFLLLTANSHRATWESIEIAKQNDIPHFIIQGSKSNLRKLLWEHKEVILNKDQDKMISQ